MNSDEIRVVLEQHKLWLNNEGGEEAGLRGAGLQGADLQGADLQWAGLQGADLRGADLRRVEFDFSSFPLWCGWAEFKCDPKLTYQLLAHVCTLEFDNSEGIKELILPFAKKSHRAKDLGLVDLKATPIKKVRGEE